MQQDEGREPIAATGELEHSARAVVEAISVISRPSDITEVLSRLTRVQEVMSQVYAGLASWHGMVEMGVHHSGEIQPTDAHNPGWVRAEVALEEASQYSKDAAGALERARSASMSARWFDEIRADQ